MYNRFTRMLKDNMSWKGISVLVKLKPRFFPHIPGVENWFSCKSKMHHSAVGTNLVNYWLEQYTGYCDLASQVA